MRPDSGLTRRSFLAGAAGAGLGLAGCSRGGSSDTVAATTTLAPTTTAAEIDCPGAEAGRALWQIAMGRGIVYGSSAATWQLADAEYRRLFERHPAIVFTEDDLLWWRLRPTPEDDLDFTYGDRIVRFAERNGMLVFGAHLVWDQGFGEGWTDRDLYGMEEARARELLFGTAQQVAAHYRGRVAGWIVANEVLDGAGMRDTFWHQSLGPSYVAEAFRIVHDADPEATLVLNDYGYETDDEFRLAADIRAATLAFVDELLEANVPLHAVGIQAHLRADEFPDGFDESAYRMFLAEVADRGLRILYTEVDVLDDGLPPDPDERDQAVADVLDQYLAVALDEPAVASLMTFGLSDRYTWLQEDFPRTDGAARRPLPFDENMKPKPMYEVLRRNLARAPIREALWRPPRCS
jgi:endo-1,4-beta-xylanase